MPAQKRKIISISSAADGRDEGKPELIPLTPELASRLLYPNPVVFLVTESAAGRRNVMTLSWLAPANNYGGFVFVIHKRRQSASSLHVTGNFVLSVAHAGQRDLLLACGKVSGASVDKFDGSIVGLTVVHEDEGNDKRSASNMKSGNIYSALLGDEDESEESDDDDDNKKGNGTDIVASSISESGNLGSISGSVASMKCTVVSMCDAADAGHWLVIAQINEASVDTRYWDGRCFAPKNPELPQLLSFLGSQRFGVCAPLADEEEN